MKTSLVSVLLLSTGLVAQGCDSTVVDPPETSPPDEVEPDPQPEPEPEAPPGPFTDVAVATDRSCAVDESGSVFCWGLDLDSAEWGKASLAPRRVDGVSGASRVALDEGYACALVDGQGLECWGYGPLVEPQATDPAAPFFLPGSEDAVDFALSAGRTCAVLSDGRVRCWGTMSDPGACFGGAAAAPGFFDLPDVDDATTVAVAGSSTCFTSAASGPRCYSASNAAEPIFFELAFDDAVKLSVAESDGCYSAMASYCALGSDGGIDCIDGFLPADPGQATRVHDGQPPAAEILWIEGGAGPYCIRTDADALWCSAADGGTVLEGARSKMAWSHACALADGNIRCWGSNEFGALGIDEPARRSGARPVAGLTDAVSVAVGEDHSCATRANGEVVCWGSNSTGQRGWASSPAMGTYHPRWAVYPDELTELPRSVPSVGPANGVFADGYRSCVSQSNGPVVCWGQDLTARLSLATPAAISGVDPASFIATGDDSQSCAVVAGGGVECWGRGWYGARVGVEHVGLSGPAVQVDGDTYRACALLQYGGLECWGGYVEGSVGAEGDPIAPQQLLGIGGAVDLSGTCVVTAAHELVCWSFPWDWSLVEDGVPTVLETGVVDVDGPCIVREDGHVECFLDYGLREPSDAPGFQEIPGVTGATRVAAGRYHGCALQQSGQVDCWGWAAGGRLGDGSRTVYLDPQAVAAE